MFFARIASFFGRFLQLSLGLRVGIVVAVVALLAFGTWKGYHTYDYIQHDNEFCQGCHLMEEPFRRFEASGHRDLSCKKCHRPTLVARSKMALTQVVEQPTQIEHHAEVPNELCAECHIDGDPQRWKLIAETAGHQVHLESDKLEGLQCVKCHTAAIHDFVPLDRTCGQSDCHPTVKVQLGKMANESELHCVSCHDFLASGGRRLGPRQEDCLQCHAMRERLQDFQFDGDPHEGRCGDCHNAHTHDQPAQAVGSCLEAACHGEFVTDPASMPTMHRGLPEEDFRHCLDCHQAHTWRIASKDCSRCHSQFAQPAAFGGRHFEHERHDSLDCVYCHDGETTHGKLRLSNALDCMGCHHQIENAARGCSGCHRSGEFPPTRNISTQMRLSVKSEPLARGLPFDHATHGGVACARCHDPSALLNANASSVTAECSACHSEHHVEGADCAKCHGADLRQRHDSSAHSGCAGSRCHATDSLASFQKVLGDCLICHGDRADHEPGGDCRACHFPGQSAH